MIKTCYSLFSTAVSKRHVWPGKVSCPGRRMRGLQGGCLRALQSSCLRVSQGKMCSFPRSRGYAILPNRGPSQSNEVHIVNVAFRTAARYRAPAASPVIGPGLFPTLVIRLSRTSGRRLRSSTTLSRLPSLGIAAW